MEVQKDARSGQEKQDENNEKRGNLLAAPAVVTLIAGLGAGIVFHGICSFIVWFSYGEGPVPVRCGGLRPGRRHRFQVMAKFRDQAPRQSRGTARDCPSYRKVIWSWAA